MKLFQKQSSNMPEDKLENVLEQTLFVVPGTDTKISWADSLEGILITGATGSGKSSGPGKHIALSMLKAGYSFCVLCVKPDEKDRWVNYAKQTGREQDLVIFNKASPYTFNFLQYEMQRTGDGAGDIYNTNNALMNLNEVSRQFQTGGAGNNEERYWDNSLRRLISRTIALLVLTDEEVSLYNMRRIVADSLVEEEVSYYEKLIQTSQTKSKIDPNLKIQAQEELEDWFNSSYFLQVINKIPELSKGNETLNDEIILVRDYWLKDFARLSDRTRSIVVESYMGIIEPFMNNGILKQKFSHHLSEDIIPENIIHNNKIIILDWPVKEYGLSGTFASVIYKSAFQGALERRRVSEESNPRPSCLWTDEYQSLCNPMSDSQFQATARSAWVSTVNITQNINSLFYMMGGNEPRSKAKSLLGNLNFKIFASNADYETNKWASEMIGQKMTTLDNVSISKDMELSKSKNQRLLPQVMPQEFTQLRSGRNANNYLVECIVFKAGKTWGKSKLNYALVEFSQQ
ncbi:MAG: TraM recognition domain-containing protein [Cyclobacteriaceae bacterium]